MSLSREEIIRMALEFGWSYYDEYKFDIDELQEFVNAICAAEREECALACEDEAVEDTGHPEDTAYRNAIKHAAAAIRARGNGGEK